MTLIKTYKLKDELLYHLVGVQPLPSRCMEWKN